MVNSERCFFIRQNLDRSTAPIMDVKHPIIFRKTVKKSPNRERASLPEKASIESEGAAARGISRSVDPPSSSALHSTCTPAPDLLVEAVSCGPITRLHMNCQFVIEATGSTVESRQRVGVKVIGGMSLHVSQVSLAYGVH